MALPRKSRRKITIDSDVFYWVIRHRVNHEERHDSPYQIPVQHEDEGQLLLLDVGFNRSGYTDRSIPVVTPRLIEACIEFAIESGWDYTTKYSSPFELDCRHIVSILADTWKPGTRYI